MRANEVCAAVRRHYGCETESPDGVGPEWAALDEFTLRPMGSTRIDLFMVRAWGGKPKGHERHAIEVKVARGDFLNEIRNPGKRAPFEAVSHRFWFATPAGLVRPDEIPDGCGLLEVHDRCVRAAVPAPRRDAEPVPELAFVEAFRRASRAQARIRWADERDLAALAVANARTIATLEQGAMSHHAAIERHRNRILALLDIARQIPIVCLCGCPLKVTRRWGKLGTLMFEHDGTPGLGAPPGFWRPERDGEWQPEPCTLPTPDLEALDLPADPTKEQG